MRESILQLCLIASGLVNVFLLWQCWRWYCFATELRWQRDNAWDFNLMLLRKEES